MKMSFPTNVEVHRFLGMVAYYFCFLSNNASTTYPFLQLNRNFKFLRRTADCEAIFIELKMEIDSEHNHDPTLPIVLRVMQLVQNN
ncbi:hypothetical protein CEXT_559261 [Caerostris extrusa]|uniref:Transposase n=1 Tax=Caerostris extrusa TaxID=172846 RepID=A0AAV4UV74_CAEEX|nr:hypothetical protein CEXT_559261 [Caerostris extrusa]